jgi:predicted Zn-ribbon and HTH transcriptional regulator
MGRQATKEKLFKLLCSRAGGAYIHPIFEDHVAGVKKDGTRIWRCSRCQKTGIWTDEWQWFGTCECKKCGYDIVDEVTCSDACRKAA